MSGLSNKEILLNILIEKTKEKEIEWKSSKSLNNIENLEQINPNAYYLIFENEWHHILNDSYYADIRAGNVYLLHEEFESGRDGTVTNSYNLYIQERDDDDYLIKTKPTCISDNEDELKELLKAIQVYINTIDSTIENFINKLNNYS